MNDSVTCLFREAVPTVEDYCVACAGLSAKEPGSGNARCPKYACAR